MESEIVSRESDRFSLPIKFKVRTTSESVCNVPARTLTSKILLQVGAETNTLDGANRTEDTATGTVTWKENAIEPARYAKKVS